MHADDLSQWYSRLAALTRAGIPIPDALRTGAAPDRATATAIADLLDAGEPPHPVWADHAEELGATDAVLLATGQLAGRFPETCDLLAERHATRAKTWRKLLAGALYPLLLLHAAALLSPFVGCFTGSGSLGDALTRALASGLLNLGMIWIVLLGLWRLARRRPAMFSVLIRPLPLWGSAVRHTALATFCGALAAMLRSGVPIGNAWRLAGEASGDGRIRAAALKAAAIIDDRRAPGAALPALGAFPADFCSLYLTGERTGALEAQLDALRAKYDDIAVNRATAGAIVYPVILYAAGALMMVTKIFGAWAGYFKNITAGIDG